jgi:hypothetical protein
MDHVGLKDRSTDDREQVGASAQGLARREFAGDRRGSGVRPDGKATMPAQFNRFRSGQQNE